MKLLTKFFFTMAAISLMFAMSCKKKDSNNNGMITDIDGNEYHSVKIGTQVWMLENLKVTRYRNGDMIPYDSGGYNEANSYCWYNNDMTNKAGYGALYGWNVVCDVRNIAPVGWHVPTDEEWTILADFLGGPDVAGAKMKSTTGWANNGNGTNSSGFTALPGGFKHPMGYFERLTQNAIFWSSSKHDSISVWDRELADFSDRLGRYDIFFGGECSVRCLKD